LVAEDAGMEENTPNTIVLESYTGIWPREALEVEELRKEVKDHLGRSGVYVLYRNDIPYYVGKGENLWNRLHSHAMRSPSPRHYFWNFFSAFAVPKGHINEAEAMLIATLPTTVNSAKPKIDKIKLSPGARRVLRKIRLRRAGLSELQLQGALNSEGDEGDDDNSES
jgi:hypothetical protein